MSTNHWSVYRHIFPDGKEYIGCTGQNPEKRWANGYGYQGQPDVFEAIIRYGWHHIRHEIVENDLSEKEARKLEKKLIEEKDKNELYNGYLYSNGIKKANRKDRLDYQIGGGTYFTELSDLMTIEQLNAFHKKIGGIETYAEVCNDRIKITRFLIKEKDILVCIEQETMFPTKGVTYREFGNWIETGAVFVETYHSEQRVNVDILHTTQ